MKFLRVPEGKYWIGTTFEQVEEVVKSWSKHLIKDSYFVEMFHSWIEKEAPALQVSSPAFDLLETPVTNGMIRPFLEETQLPTPESALVDSLDLTPVWGVSLDWATQFTDWLSLKDKSFCYRLPTESEWEIAARGPDRREYSYGHEFNPKAANTKESGFGRVTTVDTFTEFAGPFGHLDLSGNIEEWVSTGYYAYPGGKTIQDDLYQRLGPSYPVLRGGSFVCGGDLSRAARRHGPFPDPMFRFTGFRLVRERRTPPSAL